MYGVRHGIPAFCQSSLHRLLRVLPFHDLPAGTGRRSTAMDTHVNLAGMALNPPPSGRFLVRFAIQVIYKRLKHPGGFHPPRPRPAFKKTGGKMCGSLINDLRGAGLPPAKQRGPAHLFAPGRMRMERIAGNGVHSSGSFPIAAGDVRGGGRGEALRGKVFFAEASSRSRRADNSRNPQKSGAEFPFQTRSAIRIAEPRWDPAWPPCWRDSSRRTRRWPWRSRRPG